MYNTNKMTHPALMIIIFSLGSKLLGFLREVLIAAKFGSSSETDVFFIALSASTFIGGFLQSSINTTFIPIISEIESKKGKNGKEEYTNNIINIILLVSSILVLIALLGTPLIVKLLAKGFKGKQFELAVKLTRIGLPMILFSGIIGVISGFLQSEGRFKSTAIMGIPLNLSYIFFLLFFSAIFGMQGLMFFVVIGVIGQLLVQIPELKISGFKYRFRFNIKDEYIRKILYLSIPVFIGVAIDDVNAIVDKTLASSLISGSISALNYAAKLNSLISGVFITAITTVIFPILSKEANNENLEGLKIIMGYGINLILLITIPATIGLIALAKPIVEIAFQRGEFDFTATLMTSKALAFYSAGLLASAIRLLIIRVFYSFQDMKTPMLNGAVAMVLNLILNLVLVKFMGHAGLALATSIATTIATIMLFYGLKKKIGSLGTKEYINTFFKTGLASAVMGLIAYTAYNGLYKFLGISKLNNLISLLVAVGLAVIIYVLLCYVLKVEEVREVIGKIKVRLTK